MHERRNSCLLKYTPWTCSMMDPVGDFENSIKLACQLAPQHLPCFSISRNLCVPVNNRGGEWGGLAVMIRGWGLKAPWPHANAALR